jgi:hypothetical protein
MSLLALWQRTTCITGGRSVVIRLGGLSGFGDVLVVFVLADRLFGEAGPRAAAAEHADLLSSLQIDVGRNERSVRLAAGTTGRVRMSAKPIIPQAGPSSTNACWRHMRMLRGHDETPSATPQAVLQGSDSEMHSVP